MNRLSICILPLGVAYLFPRKRRGKYARVRALRMIPFAQNLCTLLAAGLLTLLSATGAYAQPEAFPEGQTKQERLDEAKIHIMGAFASASVNSRYPDAEELTRELLAFSQSKNSEPGIADAYSKFADIYTYKQQEDSALYYCRMAKALYLKMSNERGLVRVICQEAYLDMQANRLETALDKYQTALSLTEATYDPDQQAMVLHAIGAFFLKLRNYTYAENYLLQALDLVSVLDIHQKMRIELDLGNLYLEQGQYDKAETRYEYCMELMRQFGEYPVQMAACKTNLANIYSQQGKLDRALGMYNESSAYYRKMYDTLNLTSVLGFKSEMLSRKGQKKQAADSLQYGLALAERIGIFTLDALTLKARLSKQLYALYRSMGLYEKALNAYEQHNRYEKEVFTVQTANRTAELKEKYQAERKEQENIALKRNGEIQDLRLKNQQSILNSFVLAILFLVLLGVLLWRNLKIRNREQNMALEQRLLRSQMNPHFIFNALIAIQSFMYKNDPKEAGSFLSSFARLVRSILENSREELIPLSKEMQWLQNYVKLQQLRFENEIDCHIECDETLDLENTWIPPMLVQPFIENALEHGLSKTDNPGLLTVKYVRYKKWLAIHIRDNGGGFDSKVAPKPRKDHASMAIKITHERLKLINRGKKKKIDLNIFSIPGSGTLVCFSIPLIIRS